MRGRALEVSLSANGSDISLIAFPIMQVLPARWCSQQQRVKASRPQAREGTCRARPGYSAPTNSPTAQQPNSPTAELPPNGGSADVAHS